MYLILHGLNHMCHGESTVSIFYFRRNIEISDLLKMSTCFFCSKKKVLSYLMINSELLIF